MLFKIILNREWLSKDNSNSMCKIFSVFPKDTVEMFPNNLRRCEKYSSKNDSIALKEKDLPLAGMVFKA